MWLQQRAVVADVSASLHVQMCNTCLTRAEGMSSVPAQYSPRNLAGRTSLKARPQPQTHSTLLTLKVLLWTRKIYLPWCPSTLSYDSSTHDWSHMSRTFKYSPVYVLEDSSVAWLVKWGSAGKEQSLMRRCKCFLGRENQIRVSLTCLAVCSPETTWHCG